MTTEEALRAETIDDDVVVVVDDDVDDGATSARTNETKRNLDASYSRSFIPTFQRDAYHKVPPFVALLAARGVARFTSAAPP
jgi:hypothetical protein